MSDKPFHLFGGEAYYPLGGWLDHLGSYATLDECKNEIIDNNETLDWAHVVDMRTMEVVYKKKNRY